MFRIDDFTPELRERMAPFAADWIGRRLETGPADRAAVEDGIRRCYAAAGLPWHGNVVWAESPLAALITGPIAARILDRVAGAVGAAVDGAVAGTVVDAVRDAVGGTVDDAVHDTVDVAADVAVAGTVRDAVSGAVSSAVGAAVDLAAYVAVRGAVDDAVSSAVSGTVVSAVSGAVGGAVRGAVDDAVCDAVDLAAYDAVRGAVRAAVDGAVAGTVGAAIRGAVAGAVAGTAAVAVGAAVDGAVAGTVVDAVRDAVLDTVVDAVSGAVAGTVGGAVRDAVGGAVVDDVINGWRKYLSPWWAWDAGDAFVVRELGIPQLEQTTHLVDAWEDASGAGLWWPHSQFTIVSDRPTCLHLEQVAPAGWGSHRLHNDTGPSIGWGDEWALWHWHGTRVPSWVIEDCTLDRIRAEENTEVRRCAIEHYGWGRFIVDLGLTPVDECDDPGNPGQTLRLYDIPREWQPFNEPVRMLVMDNASRDRDGSRRTFAETVPADIESALAAAAWQFGVNPDVYTQVARAT